MVIILFIRRHIDDFFRYPRIFRIRLVDLAVRRFHKAVLIDPRIACKRIDQADVRTLRGLNGTHSPIMRIVYIADLESCTVTGQTARPQRGQTSLMGQLSQRIVLIHELGQLGRTKELLHGCCHRLDIDQGLGRDPLRILCGHAFPHHSLQTGETDPVLILEQFADRTNPAVAEMVNVILVSHAVLQMHVIVNGCQNVILCNMLRYQFRCFPANRFL